MELEFDKARWSQDEEGLWLSLRVKAPALARRFVAGMKPVLYGGLGVEENIVTLCPACHDRYDNGEGRAYTREELTAYLRGKYPDWNEKSLRYRKYRGKEEEA